MEELEYSEETRYVWDCPCGQLNEECEDPEYNDDTVICESCGKEFKLKLGE